MRAARRFADACFRLDIMAEAYKTVVYVTAIRTLGWRLWETVCSRERVACPFLVTSHR